MADLETKKTSELPVNSSPSTSTTLVGVDNGETVQIPITDFVTNDEDGNVTVTGKVTVKDGMDVMGESIFRNDITMQGGSIEIQAGDILKMWNETDSKSSVLYCSDDGELLLDGKPVATKDDIPSDDNFVTKDENGDVTVNALKVDDSILCVGTLDVKEGYSARFWSNDNSKNASLCCDDNGKLSLNGKAVATVDDIPSGDGTSSGEPSIPYISFGCYFTVADLMNELPSEVMISGQPAIVSFMGMLNGTFLCRFNNYHSDYYGCEFTDLTNLKTYRFEGYSSSLSLYDNLSNGGSSGGGSAINLDHSIPVTYAELRALRDAGSLVPGMFYRITDYVCTTAQENTRATDHRFDIIIQAISNDRLSETAKADYNSEDSYFSDNNANLSAWEIKYCLDNDTNRFTWAMDQGIVNIPPYYGVEGTPLTRQPSFDGSDNGYGEYKYAWGTMYEVWDGDNACFVYSKTPTLTNGETVYRDGEYLTAEVVDGKGVIYYMKDEHGNECSYDFKNIQFKRWEAAEDDQGVPILSMNEDMHEFWAYTFCGTSFDSDGNKTKGLDGSTAGYWGVPNIYDQYSFHNNVIKPQWYDDNLCENNKLRLNNIVLQGVWHNTDIGIEYSDCSYDNVFEDDCYNITLGYGCCNNHFGTWNYHITVGRSCAFNEFEKFCYSNHLGEGVNRCYFGENASGVNISSYCCDIRLGKYTYEISIGEECNHITIGESSSEIGIGLYSQYINIGDNCSVINTGESVHHITFGDGCYAIGFGEGSHHITFGRYGGETSIGDYSNWMTFGDGCQCNYFEGQCSKIVLGRDCYNNHFCVNQYIYLDDCCHDNSIEPETTNIRLRTFISNQSFGESGPPEGLAIYTSPGIVDRQI